MNILEKLPFDWTGETAVCIGGGASLTKDQVDKVKGLKVIAVNDAYKIAPWADILYACDRRWWDWHKGVINFQGYRLQHYYESYVKGQSSIKPYPGINIILSDGSEGFSDRPARIRHGGNSGYQALHIAMKMKAKRIILLGYDMHMKTGKVHWFGNHPGGGSSKLDRDRYIGWMKKFPALQEAAERLNIEIINCTPGSALECFKKRELDATLSDCKE